MKKHIGCTSINHLQFYCIFLICFITNAQDWPNLERFAQDNKALTLTARESERIVFMGNSITEGWPNHHPEFFERKPYVLRGISGQTTSQMLLRFKPDVIDLKPKMVILLAGTNDIAGNTGPTTEKTILDNIFSMAELAKSHHIKVLLCSILPAFDYPWKPRLAPAQKIVRLNTAIKAYALENDCFYVDYFSAMADEKQGLKKSLTYDGVHPNKAGYLVMETIITNSIADTK